jgi:RNA-directed DNA polymerase
MASPRTIAHRLATAILGGRLTEEEIIKRSGHALGRRWTWLRAFAKRIVAHFGAQTRPRQLHLERFIATDTGFRKACSKHLLNPSLASNPPPRMSPAPGPAREWQVPSIRTPHELTCRLNLTPGELDWFANVRSGEKRPSVGPLQHYCYRWQEKCNGLPRLIESPKQRLRAIQRWVLAEILNRIPPHPAAHGFRSGRSTLSFAQPHVGRHLVLKLDLKDFFPGILKARVVAIFMTAGYPEAVAQLLAGLCTNHTPAAVIRSTAANLSITERQRLKNLYQRPHLPQGAPTSPALANLAAFRLDCRLAGLATAAGGRYTRYADDLVFSGDAAFAKMIDRFHIQACAIALEERFEVQTRKTRVMRQSRAQRAVGLVLNTRLNIPRPDYDQLKAILHNCIRHGPASQNRDGVADFPAHLAGRIAYVEQVNPQRGRRLREAFGRITW